MTKLLAFAFLVLGSIAQAQSVCPAPTPGVPHVCLTWPASPTSGVSYNVYRSTTAGGENYGTPLNTSPITTLSFYDTTVTVGTKYFYTVTAVAGGVLSIPSPEVSAQIPVPPGAPGAPSAIPD